MAPSGREKAGEKRNEEERGEGKRTRRGNQRRRRAEVGGKAGKRGLLGGRVLSSLPGVTRAGKFPSWHLALLLCSGMQLVPLLFINFKVRV